jgi:4'-phosphopantetheinyl transferase
MPTSGESIQVWVVPLAGQTAGHWRPALSPAEWQKAMRFRLPADQVRSAITRGALRTLLGRYLAVQPSEIEFTQNEFGKPAVAGLHFNVSHSGDYALLAFAKSAPIGIDIEQIKGDRVVRDLARRVLTDNEHHRFTSLPEPLQERIFFEIWTLKESLLKAIGSGLSVPPEHLEIAFSPDRPQFLASSAIQITDVSEWAIESLDIGDTQYAAAVAVQQRAPLRVEINRFESHSPDNISPQSLHSSNPCEPS